MGELACRDGLSTTGIPFLGGIQLCSENLCLFSSTTIYNATFWGNCFFFVVAEKLYFSSQSEQQGWLNQVFSCLA